MNDSESPKDLDKHEIKDEQSSPSTSRTHKKSARKTVSLTNVIGIGAVVAIVMGASGFAAGMQYRNGDNSTVSTTGAPNGATRGAGGFRSGRGGSFGTVTAVSDSSLTITPMQGGPNSSNTSGTTKTYKITSSTVITANGATGSVSDIKSGDTVVIRTSTTDTATATSIRVGDAPGSMNQMNDNSSSNNDSSTSTN